MEVVVELESKVANKFGVSVLKSPDDREHTLIYYDAENKKLKADGSKSSLRNASFAFSGNRRQSTDTRMDIKDHFDLSGETLKLHFFLDKSLIQVYANDRNTITTWSYPTLPDSKGIAIWSERGDVNVKSIKIWELKSIYY